MKERPIIFSAPMVLALDRKTQTRRIVKPQPTVAIEPQSNYQAMVRGAGLDCCRYGVPGDRLWVRETWATSRYMDDQPPRETKNHGLPFWYAADDSVRWTGATSGGPGFTAKGKWRPAIHMPRWASRITVEISEIRVERLQDITDEDAIAEGASYKVYKTPWGQDTGWSMDWSSLGKYDRYAATGTIKVSDICLSSPRWAFCNYIEKILGQGSWDANPWVWVVSFQRIDS